jgi:regulator of replication initiation timing
VNEVEYIETLLGQIDRLNEDLHKVKRSNSKLKGENRHLQRIIRKKNEELEKNRKPYLRKGQKRSRHGRI